MQEHNLVKDTTIAAEVATMRNAGWRAHFVPAVQRDGVDVKKEAHSTAGVAILARDHLEFPPAACD